MATFGKTLADRAAELTQVISGELAEGLDLSDPKIQQQVIANIAAAYEDLKIGIEGLETWKNTAVDRASIRCGSIGSGQGGDHEGARQFRGSGSAP